MIDLECGTCRPPRLHGMSQRMNWPIGPDTSISEQQMGHLKIHSTKDAGLIALRQCILAEPRLLQLCCQSTPLMGVQGPLQTSKAVKLATMFSKVARTGLYFASCWACHCSRSLELTTWVY